MPDEVQESFLCSVVLCVLLSYQKRPFKISLTFKSDEIKKDFLDTLAKIRECSLGLRGRDSGFKCTV